MPSIGRIQSTNFQTLLTSLGIVRNNIPFDLRSEVTPVVLVGGTVSFIAAPSPPYRVTDVFTNGVLVNPAAGAVLADTGPLLAGAYTLQVFVAGPINQDYDLEWRDVPNAANLVSQRWTILARTNIETTVRFQIDNDNERFRVIIVGAGGAGNSYQATIMARI